VKLLVTGAWKFSTDQIEKIVECGHSVIIMNDESGELPCPSEEIEGVICNSLFLYHEIKNFISLRYIQLTSAGFDRIPLDYIEEHSIEIHNARGVYSIPMAEYAVCGVLQLYKQSEFFLINQKQHKWEKHRGLLELYGKTVGIVGCGSVGTECAKRFAAFGCYVIGVDKYPREDTAYHKMISVEMLEQVMPEIDVIVLTLPLDEASKHLIGQKELESMKDGSIIVNISRGAVIDEDVLISHLEQGRISAVLDVFEEEPLCENSPLWKMDNVILTPHNSFVGENNADRLWNVILGNLEKCQEIGIER